MSDVSVVEAPYNKGLTMQKMVLVPPACRLHSDVRPGPLTPDELRALPRGARVCVCDSRIKGLAGVLQPIKAIEPNGSFRLPLGHGLKFSPNQVTEVVLTTRATW